MAADVLPISNLTYLESAQVLGRAFKDDPLVAAVLRGQPPDERLNHMTALFTAGLLVCVRRGSPLAVMERDKTLAAAIIYPPGTYPLPIHEQVRVALKTIGGGGPLWAWSCAQGVWRSSETSPKGQPLLFAVHRGGTSSARQRYGLYNPLSPCAAGG